MLTLKLFIKLIRVVNLTANLQVYLQLMYAALGSAATSCSSAVSSSQLCCTNFDYNFPH